MTGATRPRRPRRRPGENRQRLIAAGIVEFGRRGYHGAGTASIAALAEVPQPHVYASFRTKGELFLACVTQVCEGIAATPAPVPDDDARLLLQALSAARDEQLSAQLAPLLRGLRSQTTEEAFAALLERAAKAQLAVDVHG